MDHQLYRYLADNNRDPVKWPNNARIAVWLVLHLEYYELNPPRGSVQDPRYIGEFGSFCPDYRTYSLREYGNRIGIFRILDLLSQFDCRATVAANSMVLEKRPELAQACLSAGHEICAHGAAASRLISSRCSESEERSIIEQAQQMIAKVAGALPAGWIAQDFGESTRSLQLLAEAGFSWVGHWPNDDRPYLTTTQPPLVSIPFQPEWDDASAIEGRKLPVWRWYDIAFQAFEQLYREGGRVFALGLHPWVIGHPHRIGYLRRLLAHFAAKPNAWFATGTEICNASE